MACEEVGNQIQLLTRPGTGFVEGPFELAQDTWVILAHCRQRQGLVVFWSDLELSPHVMFHQLGQGLAVTQQQVHPHAAGHSDATDAFDLPRSAQQVEPGAWVSAEVFAGFGPETASASALGWPFCRTAVETVHVGRGAAQITDFSREFG
jgi:hypothetical protein